MGKVVILLSDKRSGSTMFQEELCKHPDIRHVDYSPHTYFETHHWLKGAVLLDMPPALFAGGCVYPGYGSRRNARTYLIECVKQNVSEFKVPIDDRELVFKGWEALCDTFSKPVFFEKSPQYLAHWASLSLILEWVSLTKHTVKFICLTRNPMSVMHSAKKLFDTDPVSRQFSWLNSQRNLLAFECMLPSGSCLHLRYENVVENPTEQFSRVFDFIGVKPSFELAKSVHTDSIEKWRADRAFNFHLDESVRQMAVKLGYSEESLQSTANLNPVIPTSSRRNFGSLFRLWRAKWRDRIVTPFVIRWRQR